MAFTAPTQDEKTQQTPATVAMTAPTSTGGAGTAGAAKATTKAANTPGVNAPAQPSAQLSAYLNANQPQAGAMAGNIAGTVGGQVNAAGQAILPAVNVYTGQLTNVPTDAALNTQLTNSPASLTADQQAAYQQELNAASQKPNSAATFETTQPYQDLSGNIQKAAEQAALWNAGNNVAQLQTALAPFEGANATTGDKQLDSLLLSQTPGAYSQIQSAVAPAATLQDQLTQATTQADTGLKTAIANDSAATAAAQQAAQTYAKNLTDYLNLQQAAALKGNVTNQSIMTDLQGGNLSATDLGLLGLSQPQWDKINAAIAQTQNGAVNAAPAGLAQYLALNPAQNTNVSQIATPQNYSDVAALLALLGNNAGNLTLPINPQTAQDAGKMQPGSAKFDYQNALSATQDADSYDASIAKMQDSIVKDIKSLDRTTDPRAALAELRNYQKNIPDLEKQGKQIAKAAGGKFNGIDTTALDSILQKWANSGY